MKPLIVYFSRTGNNENLAMHLQQRLDCPIKIIIDKNKQRGNLSLIFNTVLGLPNAITVPDINFEDHETVILIAPIWAGHIAGPMQTFIRRYRHQLKNVAFATLCGGSPGQRENIHRQLARLLRKDPAGVIELQLSQLLSSRLHPAHQNAGNYRIQQEDWAFFDNSISRFIANLDPVTTQSSPRPAQPFK